MPTRRTEELHRLRYSLPSHLYFVTCCSVLRAEGLADHVVAAALTEAVKNSDRNSERVTTAFTVMPDHCHWLFQLGPRLPLDRVVAKFKFYTRLALRRQGLVWQRDYYEHRLRPDEGPEDYALYIFLNPYRAGLLPTGERWPWWWTGCPQALRFILLLDAAGAPPREWSGLPVPASIKHGD